MIPQEYVGPYIGSNVVSLVLLGVAWRWPQIARYVYALIFVAAGLFNTLSVRSNPEWYTEFYYDSSILQLYKDFIAGVLSQNTILIIQLIAIGQFAVGVMLCLRGFFFKLGVLGGIIFLLAIMPLGFGSAFPATLIMALTIYLFYRKLELSLAI